MPKRGKTKEQKYEEAVERNIRSMINSHARISTGTKSKYVGVTLSKAKQMLGIRQDDTRFDADISEKIKEPKKKKKDDKESK